MRKIVVHEFISLDGVIQAPGGAEEDTDGGFAYGGWTVPYWHNEIGAHFAEAFGQADTLLLGRKTWQTHGEAFEAMEGDSFADSMNAIRKVVVSTTLKNADLWRNSAIISSQVVEEVRRLKQQEGKDILIDGSSVLLHTLIEHDLVEEFQLHVYPLVLGGGKRLFPEEKQVKLKLLKSETVPSGVIFQQYELAK